MKITGNELRNIAYVFSNIDRDDLTDTGIISNSPGGSDWSRFNNDLTIFILKLPQDRLDLLARLVSSRLPLAEPEAIEAAFLSNIFASMKKPVRLSCVYTNHRGETRVRSLEYRSLWHGKTEWHPEPCLLLKAVDLETGNLRDFKVADLDTSTLAILDPGDVP